MPPRILIAEPDTRIAAALEALLQRRGYATDRAGDGVETLSRVVAAPPAALLLALELPRLSGTEVLRKLRRSDKTRGLPVVACGEAGRKAEIETLGVAGWLERPYRRETLLAALSRALEGGAPVGSGPPAAEPVHRHLGRAWRQRFSGCCRLRAGRQEHALWFFDGAPVALQPGFEHRDFGHYLQRLGRLSEAEYAYFSGPGEGCPETLVQMGCLAYPELLKEQFAYLESELVAAVAGPPRTARLRPFESASGIRLATVNLPRILLRGFRRRERDEDLEGLLDEGSARYVAADPRCGRIVSLLEPGPGEQALLPALDGSRTLEAVGREHPQAAALLLTLAALGLLRFAEAPRGAPAPEEIPRRGPVAEEVSPAEEALENFADLVAGEDEGGDGPAPAAAEASEAEGRGEEVRRTHAELQGKNYYEVFGLQPGSFSFEQLRERYFDFTRRFGPETLMQLGGQESVLAEEILALVADAYNTLSDVVRKERYDEMLGSDRVGLGEEGDERFQAEVQSQSGKVFIEMEEWDNAEKALQDACNLDPDSGDYLAHLAWAIFRNPRYADSRATRDKARRLLNKALTLERLPKSHAFKGWMLLEGEQEALAEAEFTKATKLDPRQALARQGLSAIVEKREQEKKGLFRRMFR